METKLLKVSAIIQHPDIDTMMIYNNQRVTEDLDYALLKFNSKRGGKFRIVSYNFDMTGRWVFDFFIEVPQDYSYNHTLLRVLSKALYHDRDWYKLSTVKTRLFTVVSHETVNVPSRTDDAEAVAVKNDAVARITLEIVGGEEIINCVKALLELGAKVV